MNLLAKAIVGDAPPRIPRASETNKTYGIFIGTRGGASPTMIYIVRRPQLTHD